VTLRYKFVELSTVTDETLEHAVNHWVAQGWQLEGIRFVVTEHSKRPGMAFVSFTRDAAPGARVAGGDAGSEPEGEPHVIAADDNDVE
jgi:hypothetical protein